MIPSDELLLRQELRAKGVIATGHRVIPSPIYFADRADYFATDEAIGSNSKDTQLEVDLLRVKCLWIVPRGFTVIDGSPEDSPRVEYLYDFVLFHERTRDREDEAETPDAYRKLLLEAHTDFMAAWLNLQEEYRGPQNLGIFTPGTYVLSETTNLIVQEEIVNDAQCEFIPGIIGYRMVLREAVRIQSEEC